MSRKNHAPRPFASVAAAVAGVVVVAVAVVAVAACRVALAAVIAPAPRAAASAAAAAAHKFHTSFAEASYNAETKSLEVSLRTFPDDVAEVVRRRGAEGGGRAASTAEGRQKAFEDEVAAYVGETFRLKTAAGGAVKIAWVGMDAGADSVWLYFEAPLPAGLEGVELRNTFLADLYDDQVNLVTVRAGARKAALRFERGGGDFRRIEIK
jgi:hypothetical protein